MTKANLNNEREQIIFGDDSIVIQKYISGIKGGRTLDVTGFSEKVIKAGHIIIRKDCDGTYKPMPVNDVAKSYDMASVLDAFKAACPHIDFIKDEEA